MKGFLATKLETIREADAELHFKINSAHYLLASLDEVLNKAALTPLKILNLIILKRSSIDDVMLTYLLPLNAAEEHFFGHAIKQIRRGPFSNFSPHICAISQKQKIRPQSDI